MMRPGSSRGCTPAASFTPRRIPSQIFTSSQGGPMSRVFVQVRTRDQPGPRGQRRRMDNRGASIPTSPRQDITGPRPVVVPPRPCRPRGQGTARGDPRRCDEARRGRSTERKGDRSVPSREAVGSGEAVQDPGVGAPARPLPVDGTRCQHSARAISAGRSPGRRNRPRVYLLSAVICESMGAFVLLEEIGRISAWQVTALLLCAAAVS